MTTKAGNALSCVDGKSEVDRIFAESDQRFDLAGSDRHPTISRSLAPGSVRHAQEPRAVGVWIAIGAEQNVVARTGARNDIDQIGRRALRELRRQPELFVRHSAGSEDRDLPAGKMFQLFRCVLDGARSTPLR